MNAPDSLQDQLRRYSRTGLVVGGVAALVLLAGLFLDPHQFFHSYIFAYTFWFGIGIASLGFLLIHHLAGGAWSAVLRPIFEAGSRTLPLLALLFVPLLFGIHDLYEWSHVEVLAEDPLLAYKASWWLNEPFFIARTVLYFLVWLALMYFLNKWADELNRRRYEDRDLARRLRTISAVGLLLFGLTTSFAGFDWLMSLEPHWYSTIYGLIVTVGWAVTMFAFTVAIIRWLGNREPVAEVVTPQLFNDYGSLLLATIMMWAYMHVSQFILIWSANIPEEIVWYLRRQEAGWGVVALIVVVFHFALPFLLLLFRDIKRNARLLAGIAIYMLVMRLVETYWLVQPAFYPDGFHIHWLDVVAPIAIGGLVLGVFFRQLVERPLVYVHDPKLEEPKEHGTIAPTRGETA